MVNNQFNHLVTVIYVCYVCCCLLFSLYVFSLPDESISNQTSESRQNANTVLFFFRFELMRRWKRVLMSDIVMSVIICELNCEYRDL